MLFIWSVSLIGGTVHSYIEVKSAFSKLASLILQFEKSTQVILLFAKLAFLKFPLNKLAFWIFRFDKSVYEKLNLEEFNIVNALEDAMFIFISNLELYSKYNKDYLNQNFL
jgi:hypothetical protein